MSEINPYDIIKYPLMGEKATGIREKENKLTFVVADKADRKIVKQAVEELYKVKVDAVNILISPQGKKKAFVKLNQEHSAEEVASHFGVL